MLAKKVNKILSSSVKKARTPAVKEVRRLDRKELEKKVIEGAKKAVTEYRRVFERLAEYDRTTR